VVAAGRVLADGRLEVALERVALVLVWKEIGSVGDRRRGSVGLHPSRETKEHGFEFRQGVGFLGFYYVKLCGFWRVIWSSLQHHLHYYYYLHLSDKNAIFLPKFFQNFIFPKSKNEIITLAFRQVHELLVLAAVDDVAADAAVAAVALHLGLVAVEVLAALVDDVAVLDVREGEAPLLGARRQLGGPRSVRLADHDGEAGALVALVALVPGVDGLNQFRP
jgi:hypothetical protein